MRAQEDQVGEREVSREQLKEGAAGLCVATLCADQETVEAVKQAVARKHGSFAGELPDYARYEGDHLFWQKLQRAEVAVCVIDFDRDRAQAVAAANSMQQTLHGRTTLIAVSAQAGPHLILEAMRAGCSEYLTKPVVPDQLSESLDRLRARSRARRRSRPGNRGRGPGSADPGGEAGRLARNHALPGRRNRRAVAHGAGHRGEDPGQSGGPGPRQGGFLEPHFAG